MKIADMLKIGDLTGRSGGLGIGFALGCSLMLSLGAASTGIASDQERPVSSATVASHSLIDPVQVKFISALLEKDAENRLQLLWKIIQSDPEHAELPLAYWLRSVIHSPRLDFYGEKYLSFWAQHPQNYHLALTGALLKLRLTPHFYPQILANLSQFWANPDPLQLQKAVTIPLAVTVRCFVELVLESGDYAQVLPRTRDIIQAFPADRRYVAYLELLPLYRTVSERLTATRQTPAVVALWRQQQRQALQDLEKLAQTNLKIYSAFFEYCLRNKFYDLAVNLTQKMFVSHRPSAFLWSRLMIAAAESGNLKLYNQAQAELKKFPPLRDFPDLHWRFTALTRAGEYAAAEQLLADAPPEKQLSYQFTLLSESGNYAGLRQVLQRQEKKELSRGLQWLIVAEKLHDVDAFQVAEKILGQAAFKDPMIANSLGYVGTVLQINLPYCEKLLHYAVTSEPKNSAYLDSMAYLRFKQQRFAEAEDYINQALKWGKPTLGMAEIFEHAGEISQARGEIELARFYYKLALEQQPFSPLYNGEKVKNKLKKLSK